MDTGSFQISVTSDDASQPSLGTYNLVASESDTHDICSAPILVPIKAKNLVATEVLPAGFTSGTGYPKWIVRKDDANATTASSGIGLTTGNVSLNAINTPNFTVLFQNQKANDADISVVKTGPASIAAGSQIVYNVTVSNAGPSVAPSVSMTDTFPAGLQFVSNTPACGALACTQNTTATSNIATISNLPVGGSVNFTLKFNVPANYLGAGGVSPISNTAVVSSTIPDKGAAGNNTSTVSTSVSSSANLAITKAGPASVNAGAPISYTLMISNAGPSAANGASYSDTVPTGVSGITATCGTPTGGAVCAVPGVAGNVVSGTVPTLPANASVTITINGTAPSSPTTLSNIATVSAPAGTTDPVPANNTSLPVSTTVNAAADLSITNDDGVSGYSPGNLLTYTIVVSNAGPSAVTGASVVDNLPATLTAATWTCAGSIGGVCQTGSGSGNINSLVNLPSGGKATFVLKATVAASATGPISTTATVAAPAGTSDAAGNNSATDTDNILATDLAITNSDGTAVYTPGGTLTYLIVASNPGSSNMIGASVVDTLPAALSGATWTCIGVAGGVCPAASGAGNINALVNLPAGGSVNFALKANVSTTNSAPIANTASVAVPVGNTDSVPGNNSATDTDNADPNSLVDIAATIDDFVNFIPTKMVGPKIVGSVEYVITVTNKGAFAHAVPVRDFLPSNIENALWSCVASSPSAHCTASGTGDIADTVEIPTGATLTYTLDATVDGLPEKPLVNSISTTAGAKQVDTDPSNNNATDTDNVGIFANDFDSTSGIAIKSVDIQASTEASGSMTIAVASAGGGSTSGAPELVATVGDRATGSESSLHLKRDSQGTQARLSILGRDGVWQFGSWIKVSNASTLTLRWSVAPSAGDARSLQQVELMNDAATIDLVDIAQELR